MGIAVVTGANRGIGLELCRQLKDRGEQVVAACRSTSPSLGDCGVEVVTNVDVTSGDAVSALVRHLEGRQVDLLINCAGILERDSLTRLDFEAIRRQLEVNGIGPLRVTAALVPLLRDGAKVAVITSRMGSIADNDSGGAYGYRMSKAAVNAATKSLAIDLSAKKIAVAALHPGYVRTEMTGGQGLIDVDESARGLLARLDELTMETSGGFWHSNGERLPW